MFDVLKKTFLTGVGLAIMTKDKVEEVARDIASSADLSADKGQEFVKEAVSRAEEARTSFENNIQQYVREYLSKADIPTREELSRLEARIAELEQDKST